jgi:hypothetical protein
MKYTKEQMFEAMMFAFNTFSDRLSISEVEDRANIYIDGLEPEWDASHELNNVMNKMVDELFPELITKEEVPFYLQDWRTIEETSQEYTDVLYKTQELVPVDSGHSLHCHHSDYELDGIMYRLTWGFTDVESDEPTMQRRFN